MLTLRGVLPTAIMAFIFLYFVFHAIQGDRGLLAQIRLSKVLETKQMELGDLQARVDFLESRVQGLNAVPPDLDLLEEQARKVLNYSYANEAVVLFN